MSRMVSFIVLVGILVAIAVVFFRVMAGFLVPLFLAALLGVVFQPLFRWSLGKCRQRRYLAAGLTTLLVLLIVLVPLALVSTLAALQGFELAERLQFSNVPERLREARKDLGLEIPQQEELRRIESLLVRWEKQHREGDIPNYSNAQVANLLHRLDAIDGWLQSNAEAAPSAAPYVADLRQALERLKQSTPETVEGEDALLDAYGKFRLFKTAYLGGPTMAWIRDQANPTEQQLEDLRRGLLQTSRSPLVAFGGGTVEVALKLIVGTIIMVAALFFFLAEGHKMLDAAIRLSPLEERYVRELVGEFDRVCRAVVAATLLAAVAQGLLAGVGFYFAGLKSSVALLMLLTMVLAMVPFAGAAAVWIPASLYLFFYEGRTAAAILLALYGAGVVSMVDNLIKPWVLHGQSNLHPLLAFLSVIGGIAALGPIGIVIGPMVVVFLQTLLKILQRELLTIDRWGGSLAAQAGASMPAGATAGAGAGATSAAGAGEEGEPAEAEAAEAGERVSAPEPGAAATRRGAAGGAGEKSAKKRHK